MQELSDATMMQIEGGFGWKRFFKSLAAAAGLIVAIFWP